MKRLGLVGLCTFVIGLALGAWLSPARSAVPAALDVDPGEHLETPGAEESAVAIGEAPPAIVELVPPAIVATDQTAALALATDTLPVATAVALLSPLSDTEVLALLRRVGLTRAAALIEAMPTDRAARLSRDLLLGPR